MTLRISAGLCTLLLAAAHTAHAQSGPIQAPQVAVGDSWTYQYTDLWKHTPGNQNRTDVTAIDAAGIHVDVRRATGNALVTRQLFSKEMNPIDRGRMHFSPSFTRYAFPLEPGKEWTGEADADNPAANKRWHYKINGKAVGWEKVTTAGGQFDAMKIEIIAYYTGEETGQRGGSGRMKETVWFAPSVNNFVKLEYEDTDWQGRTFNRDQWELMAYRHP